MIRIFNYLESLQCFVVDPDYKKLSDYLGLTEWNEVVWIGRFFLMDNDVGEHWFDNWDLREPLRDKAAELGLDETELFVIDPDRFNNGSHHTDEERGLFWKDVLLSLQLSYETLFREARKFNEERTEFVPYDEDYIPDLEDRILEIKNNSNNH